ncbi:uncharacterized protein BDZ99DRAFT_468825 [Mytilinidion resinicola]|uniref:Uncharacterized protein n=1 Tax=Mytilinidion resinicola TaxID=574789 RepID=A0A6A6Y295_9PEZI|nr:uncharacterized protein BDZ99DRAFT_468825 [Mytilinidion resinicola]KAF2802633.1 hypothetical protein BDZ99DRAFT_468825 [Mytilinidion resinicola]
MSSYTIIIENKNTATGPPKVYNIYTEMPGISGDTGLQSMFSVAWYKSLGIPRGGRDTFRFTTNVYAFVGSSSEYSTQLAAGHAINIINSAVAKVDPRRQKGSQFLLTKDFDINDSKEDRAKAGAFDFSVESAFDEPNKYVVGVAREQVGGQLTPVAVVDLKSSADYVFEPKPKVYVSCTSVDRGEVFTPPTTAGQFAEIEYKDGRKTALVTESAGAFSIAYI